MTDTTVTTTIGERHTHFRTCPLCEASCGLEITTEGDRVVRIQGDRNDPVSKGFICLKGSTLKQLHEDGDRLRTSPASSGRSKNAVARSRASPGNLVVTAGPK